MRPAWIEINLDALRKNFRNLKKCVAGNAGFMAVIKADGYGHGVEKVAETLLDEGVDRLAIVTVEEGIELRELGFNDVPILMLGHTPEEDVQDIIEYNLIPTVYRYDQAAKLNKAAEKTGVRVPVHIKIDTGMGRLGFIPGETAIKEITRILELPGIYVEGIFSHLATADRVDNDFVREQFTKFQGVVKELEQKGINIPIKHLANSGATINYPEMHLDMVRPGTSLYGLYPGPETAANTDVKLYPVMEAKAELIHIKEVSPGTPVSYSSTFVAERDSVIGVVPMGYVDGVYRVLANRGEVLVKGQRCPIVGNICMDHFMVDLTDLAEVNRRDEVVFFGRQGDEMITADEVGEIVGTISIEVVNRMGHRMPRFYEDK